MFKNTFQSGFLSILYSIGSKPLQIWDKQGKRPDMSGTRVAVSGEIVVSQSLDTKAFVCSSQWPHQTYHRQRYPVQRLGDYEQQRQHDIHHLSS